MNNEKSEYRPMPFFVLSEMHDDDGNYDFKKDEVFNSFTECVDEVKRRVMSKINMTFTKEEIEGDDIYIPNEVEIYKMLYESKFFCYVIGEGSPDYRMVFHVSKLAVGNKVEPKEMEFCEP